jgi:Peptidase family M23
MLSFVSLITLALAVECSARPRTALDGCAGAYHWPVWPLDQPHPIRGGFGDPRTRFAGPRSQDALLTSDGSFSFHQGIDINAPDGAPVYAVSSGTVTRSRGRRVTVTCGNGRSFQYWHIYEKVRVGQRVVPGRTLIGRILPKREHVHLTELVRGVAVNPVARGHLTPYTDATAPEVRAVTVRREGSEIPTHAIQGRVLFVVDAVDTPTLDVRGRWQGSYPVTPVRIAWRIVQDGRIVVQERNSYDVRRSLPKNDRFWGTFARGTYQNWPVFASRHYRREEGRQLFKLTARLFDTRTLRDGVYELVVTAEDVAGNRDVQSLGITVHNAPDLAAEN